MKRALVLFFLFIAGCIFFYNFSIIKNTISILYGNHFYESKSYLDAQKRYSSIEESESLKLQADVFYNLGNTLYRMGEKYDNESRIRYWKESIASYKKSLAIEERSITKENLYYVEGKLEEYTKKAQEKEENTQKQNKKEETENTLSGTTKSDKDYQEKTQTKSSSSGAVSSSNESSSSGSGVEKMTDLKNEKESSNTGTYDSMGGKKNDLNKQLSPDELSEIKKYMDSISIFQKENSRLFQPKEKTLPGDISQDFKNLFGNDSFFQEMLPKDERKKDW